MARTPRNRSRRGFTLLEIMIVVLIIGLILAIAIPTFQTVRQGVRNTAFMNDVRILSGGFEQYAMEYGQWPIASPSPGLPPPGAEDMVSMDTWTKPNTLGGYFLFMRDAAGIRAGIASSNNVTATLQQLQRLDEKMDDGDLTSGSLFLDGSGRLVWRLEG